jgi:hypothetical protein
MWFSPAPPPHAYEKDYVALLAILDPSTCPSEAIAPNTTTRAIEHTAGTGSGAAAASRARRGRRSQRHPGLMHAAPVVVGLHVAAPPALLLSKPPSMSPSMERLVRHLESSMSSWARPRTGMQNNAFLSFALAHLGSGRASSSTCIGYNSSPQLI